MAKQTECVWFRNKLTGAVDGVDKGSAAHRRMITEVIEGEGEDSVPFIVWEELTGDQIPETSTAKYKPGMQAEVFLPQDPRERGEKPPEADPAAVRSERNARPNRDPGKRQSSPPAPPGPPAPPADPTPPAPPADPGGTK